MRILTRVDFLIVCLVFIFILDVVAIIASEQADVFFTVIGATVTIIGYAFLRPQLVEECFKNGGK